MDGFMPIKTGWDATKEIREREAAAGVSATGGLIIIGVTGATTSEDARKCLDCGMTDFIPKVTIPPNQSSPSLGVQLFSFKRCRKTITVLLLPVKISSEGLYIS
jgi:CheY-like chemotaxis protein